MMAGACALLGRSDEAFARLERAYREHDPVLPTLNYGSIVAGRTALRSDPRLGHLMRRIGLEPAPDLA